MNFSEYQHECIKTAIYPNVGKNFIYPVLGLVEEWSELCELFEGRQLADFYICMQNELGDLLWYIAMAAIEFCVNIDLTYQKTNLSLERLLTLLHKNIIVVVREAKRIIRDDQSKILQNRIELLSFALSELLSTIEFLCQYFRFDIEEIMKNNIEKLAIRKSKGTISGSGDYR